MNSPSHSKVVASIVTANYIPQAMTTFQYLKESNPSLPYLVLIIGERSPLETKLPDGPTWMFWDELVSEQERTWLAMEYLPFELSCVLRGRLHRYFAAHNEYEKWIVIDTDIGVLASLEPLYQQLDHAPICLTAHAKLPPTQEEIIPQESNLLELGLYNGGVVAMRRSDEAGSASQWLCERLEKYGRSRRHRQHLGLQSESFEFVDQIWLNLIPVYFPKSAILYDEIFNLGHWNLFQGILEIKNGIALFNNDKVCMIHFSGLPEDRLDYVAAHDSIYRKNPNQAWALLARNYLDRLNHNKQIFPPVNYCYDKIQPRQQMQYQQQANDAMPLPIIDPSQDAKPKLIRRLQDPSYIIGLVKWMAWRLKRTR